MQHHGSRHLLWQLYPTYFQSGWVGHKLIIQIFLLTQMLQIPSRPRVQDGDACVVTSRVKQSPPVHSRREEETVKHPQATTLHTYLARPVSIAAVVLSEFLEHQCRAARDGTWPTSTEQCMATVENGKKRSLAFDHHADFCWRNLLQDGREWGRA